MWFCPRWQGGHSSFHRIQKGLTVIMTTEAKKTDWKKEIRDWVLMILVAIILATLVNTQLVVNAQIPSGSMENTIMTGDRVIGSRLVYKTKDPERFDIIVFHYPDNEEELFIKRIIGLPGETVNIIDGKVYIDDSTEPLDDSFIAEEMKGSFGPYTVPEDCYFVMGDNRNNSHDSRFWDNPYVSRDKILGKAYFRYWPLTKMGRIE